MLKTYEDIPVAPAELNLPYISGIQAPCQFQGLISILGLDNDVAHIG